MRNGTKPMKYISILLALLLLCSLLPLGALAEEEQDLPGEAAEVLTEEPTDEPADEPTDEPADETTDEATDEVTDEPTDEPTDEVPEVEEGACEEPMMAPVSYPVWVGGTQVTSENADNILNDSGTPTATYDPETKTLTFTVAEPNISGSSYSALIYANGIDLTIDAPNGLTLSSSVQYGVYVQQGSLTVNGDTDITTASNALRAPDKDLVLNGDVNATSTGENHAIFAKDVTVNGDITADGANAGIYGGESVTIHGSADVTGGTNSAIFSGSDMLIDGDVTGSSAQWMGLETKNGSIEIGGDVSITAHSSAVNANGDLTIDGDVDATSTGNNHAIMGHYVRLNGNVTANGYSAAVDATEYLCIEGNAELHAKTNCAIYCGGNVLIVGTANISTEANVSAVEAMGTVEVGYGTWTMDSPCRAISADDGIDFDPQTHEITTPEGGIVSKLTLQTTHASNPVNNCSTITESDGTTVAKHAVISRKTSGLKFPVWVGDTQVTSENADNILSDTGTPTATYDPESNTLDLNDPTVTGSCQNGIICYIPGPYDPEVLNITGSATIGDGSTKVGFLGIEGDLSFDGDFEASGTEQGVCAWNISVTGGTLNATGGEAGIDGEKTFTVSGGDTEVIATGTGANSSGIIVIDGSITLSGGSVQASAGTGTGSAIRAKKTVTVSGGTVTAEGGASGIYAGVQVDFQNGLTRVDATGTSAAIVGFHKTTGITLGDKLVIVLPEGGSALPAGDVSMMIFESDGTAVAKHAIIQPLPRVIGVKANVTGAELSGGTYNVKTDSLETLFESAAAEVTLSTGCLYTDSACTDPLTSEPAPDTPCYFMLDVHAYNDGETPTLQWADNDTIKTGSDLTADKGTLEIVALAHSPSGGSLTVLCRYTELSAPPAPAVFTVTFDANGHGAAPAAQSVADGDTASRPANPTASGWTFGGWYTDAACTAAYDFDTPVTEDLTLYARWTQQAAPGEAVYTVVSGGDGTWTKGSDFVVAIIVKRSVADETCFAHFTGVDIDGEALVNGTDYDAVAGSTVVTLKTAALEQLSPGTHTVTVLFDDGKAETTLTVQPESGTEPAPTDGTSPGGSSGHSSGHSSGSGTSQRQSAQRRSGSPRTGDTSRLGLWVALMVLSAVGFGVSLTARQRRSGSRRSH